MILNDNDIRSRIKGHALIENFEKKNLQVCSYDLTITENILKFSDTSYTRINLANDSQIIKFHLF